MVTALERLIILCVCNYTLYYCHLSQLVDLNTGARQLTRAFLTGLDQRAALGWEGDSLCVEITINRATINESLLGTQPCLVTKNTQLSRYIS